MFIEDLISSNIKSAVSEQLKKQILKSTDLYRLISAALGLLGKRATGATGERAAEEIKDKLGDYLINAAKATFVSVTESTTNDKINETAKIH